MRTLCGCDGSGMIIATPPISSATSGISTGRDQRRGLCAGAASIRPCLRPLRSDDFGDARAFVRAWPGTARDQGVRHQIDEQKHLADDREAGWANQVARALNSCREHCCAGGQKQAYFWYYRKYGQTASQKTRTTGDRARPYRAGAFAGQGAARHRCVEQRIPR